MTPLLLTAAAVLAGPALPFSASAQVVETTQRLFGWDYPDGLLEIDTGAGTATVLFPSMIRIEAMAADHANGILYGIEDPGNVDNQLVSIDTCTGAVTPIGPPLAGYKTITAMSFDDTAGCLYAADQPSFTLIKIDPSNGAATKIGNFRYGPVNAMAIDPQSGVLYASLGVTLNRLAILDKTNSNQSLLSLSGASVISALDFDASTNILWARATFTGLGSYLATVDTTSGLASMVLPLPQVSCMAFFTPPRTPQPYCTAGTSAAGCQAQLVATGVPSATAPTGFNLSVTGAEGGKAGVFYFGSNGRQASPWGNGTSYQCVAPPVVRTGMLFTSGSAGNCDGTAAVDLNAIWTATPAKNPGPGVRVQAQFWYRDPFNTSSQTTSLSAAVEACVEP